MTAIARQAEGARRRAAYAEGRWPRPWRRRGAGMVTGRISTMATTVMATGTHGSRSRAADPSNSPPSAAPTTNAPTSTVTSRSVAERRRSPRDPGHRGNHRGIGRRGDGDGQCAADHRDPRVLGDDGECRSGEQHATGEQRGAHDQVAAHRVGQPCSQPGDRDVGEHPCAAGEAEQPRVVGVRSHEDQQQRPLSMYFQACVSLGNCTKFPSLFSLFFAIQNNQKLILTTHKRIDFDQNLQHAGSRGLKAVYGLCVI